MSENYLYIQDLLARLPEVPPDSILSQAVYSGDDVRVVLFRFAPGQELTEHTAAQPALLHVLEGRGRLTVNGDVHLVGPGSWLRLAAHVPHSVVAETQLSFLLVLVRCADVAPAPREE